MTPEELKQEAAPVSGCALESTEHRSGSQELSVFTCPDCGGRLWEAEHGKAARWRCRSGHAFSGDALLQSGRHGLEKTLRAARRMMRERRVLLNAMTARGQTSWSHREQEHTGEVEKHLDRLRKLLSDETERGPGRTVPE